MTPLVATFWFDPAWASVLNLVLLLMIRSQAKELARTAKGSETRAENAAAEITQVVGTMMQLAEQNRRIKDHVEAVLAEVARLVEKAEGTPKDRR